MEPSCATGSSPLIGSRSRQLPRFCDVRMEEGEVSLLGCLPQVLLLETGGVGVVEVVQDGDTGTGTDQARRQVESDESGAAGKQNGGSRGDSGRGIQWISSIRSTARLALRRISSGTSTTYRFWRSESRVSCRVI